EMTRDRTEVVLGYVGALSGAGEPPAAPVAPPPPPPPPAPVAPVLVAETEAKAWSARCWSNGRCEAVTDETDAAGGAALRLARASLDSPWTVAVRWSPNADFTGPDGVSLQVDAGDPIALDDWDADTVLELMRRGLLARASVDRGRTVDFSLRGLTASMRWIDETQRDARRTH
ncbi:MAG: hypothetical protein MI723_10965, partial [Caulobacterales bacterium]|nr:hypothetical protein [Caulobacterales bacterium]